jgi:hypothetical protein
MALPDSIQRQVDEANEIERQFAEMNAQQAQADLPGMVVEQAPILMADIESTPNDPVAEPVAEAAAAPTAEAPPAPEVDPNDETWAHKYRVLQGRYNAEVPRLHQQTKELKAELADLQARLTQAPTGPATPETSPVDELRKKYGDAYGDDLANDTEALARAIVAKELEKEARRVEQLERQIQETQASNAQAQFFATLSARVPHWQDINADQGWIAWLGEFDPVVGATRQDVLDYAQSQADADRVAAIFEAYVLTRQPMPVAVPTAQRPLQTGYIQDQVVPRSQGTAPSVAQPARRVYSEREIGELLDIRHLRRLPAEQQKALRNDIDLAVAEGRIVA